MGGCLVARCPAPAAPPPAGVRKRKSKGNQNPEESQPGALQTEPGSIHRRILVKGRSEAVIANENFSTLRETYKLSKPFLLLVDPGSKQPLPIVCSFFFGGGGGEVFPAK